MALRKYHIDELVDSDWVDHTIEIDPFGNQPDNGIVHIYSLDKTSYVALSYNQIARLYGLCFPSVSRDCDGNKIPNWASLTDEERETWYSHFPDQRPENK